MHNNIRGAAPLTIRVSELHRITRSGKSVMVIRLAQTFEKAGKEAGIPFKVTLHVLRASTVTYLKQQGF